MSYLEMASASLPNMNKGIISIWFRDARKNPAPPPKAWPSGAWFPGTDSMLPPDVYNLLKQESQSVFYWNAYGRYISLQGVSIGLFGPAAVMIPTPPPFITNDMHMMLTFGNPNQSYNYSQWQMKDCGVIEAVQYIPALILGPQWSVPAWPPPYAPWIKAYGKFTVKTLVVGASTSIPDYVPQSFVGVDKDGYLTICLQTDTKADYKGYAFQLDKATEIWATQSYFEAPPHLALGSGHWVKVPGYWDGYQFEYKDISNEVMGAQPETFVIGGPPSFFDFSTLPPVADGAWHHLLFSFDIGGVVSVVMPSKPQGTSGLNPPPIVSTSCRAWLVLDNKEYDGTALQHRFAMHDGFTLPVLPGMGTDIIGFGPVTSATRSRLALGANDILPRNCWIIPMRGNPKDDLLRFVSTAGLWEAESSAYIEKGDFNFFVWTADIWTLFAAGDWRGEVHPPRPTVPDPYTFDPPTYSGFGFSIPVAGHPIGIPAATHHLQHNTGIEMAELQIWANKAIDVGSESIRRLFITKDGKPEKMSKAEQVLGVPDIKLHGSNNWKKGKNTGGSGGQFAHIAGIEKYKPEPKLGR